MGGEDGGDFGRRFSRVRKFVGMILIGICSACFSPKCFPNHSGVCEGPRISVEEEREMLEILEELKARADTCDIVNKDDDYLVNVLPLKETELWEGSMEQLNFKFGGLTRKDVRDKIRRLENVPDITPKEEIYLKALRKTLQ